MTQVKYASRAYLVEFALVVTLYVIAVTARPYLAGLSRDANVHFAVMALPIVPIWLTLIVVVRHYLRIDERERLKLLENVSIAAGVMACLVTSYSALEDAGLPKLAITWAWPTFAACWGLATGISSLRNR
jgi:heme/copper-type cytochrome/quinol oxidase subunit 4